MANTSLTRIVTLYSFYMEIRSQFTHVYITSDQLYADLPLFSIHCLHSLEAGPILDLSWYWLWSLYPTLSNIEGNVDSRC